MDDAKPVDVVINGIPMTAEVKEFSTGSLGWYLNGKANIKVDEKNSQRLDWDEPDNCRFQGVAKGECRVNSKSGKQRGHCTLINK